MVWNVQQKGLFFEDEILNSIRDRFYLLSEDENGNSRLFLKTRAGPSG